MRLKQYFSIQHLKIFSYHFSSFFTSFKWCNFFHNKFPFISFVIWNLTPKNYERISKIFDTFFIHNFCWFCLYFGLLFQKEPKIPAKAFTNFQVTSTSQHNTQQSNKIQEKKSCDKCEVGTRYSFHIISYLSHFLALKWTECKIPKI